MIVTVLTLGQLTSIIKQFGIFISFLDILLGTVIQLCKIQFLPLRNAML